MSIRSFCAQLSASGRLKDRDAALAELKNALDDRDTRIALSPEAWSQLCIHFARYVELELLLPRSAGKGDAATPTTDRQNARALQHAVGER